MPELPEVETIVRWLRPLLTGKTVVTAELLWRRTLAAPSPQAFLETLPGHTIDGLSRRAKFLHVLLNPPASLLFHLRMSGDLRLESPGYVAGQHDRLLLHLSDGLVLVFHDPRKFGRVWLTDNPAPLLASLGPEPLSEAFTPDWLYQALHQHRRRLKPLLLDQTFLAGLGNIYADEALHRSRLHPLRLSHTITTTEARRLHTAIRQVLQEGIRLNGASIDNVYRHGSFQTRFRVYGRAGKPCLSCGTPIVRLTIGQRSAHFCPVCQTRS
jgi:formamidopyrimidine-DNA glycosylase